MTSTGHSPSVGSAIGLALLRNGRARHGQTVRVCDPMRHGETFCEVVSPVFVDPDGKRARADVEDVHG